MNFFKRQKTEDEWLVQTKNKIYGEVYVLVALISGISLIVKYFFLKLGFASTITEIIILLIGSLYYSFRSVYLGVHAAEIELAERKSKWKPHTKNLIYGIVFGLGISLFMGINSAVQYAEGSAQSISYFLLTFVVSLIIYLPLFIIILVVGNEMMKRKSQKVADKLLEDASIGDDNEKH